MTTLHTNILAILLELYLKNQLMLFCSMITQNQQSYYQIKPHNDFHSKNWIILYSIRYQFLLLYCACLPFFLEVIQTYDDGLHMLIDI